MEKWMRKALQLAEEALKKGEVPVGCIFIYNDEIIAQGSNTVNETRNATRHAEINCIDNIISLYKDNWKSVFHNTHVVVTVEPCIMCASALHSLQVASITYGCANDRFGGCFSVLNTSKLYPNPTPITGNVFGNEAMNLLVEFYKGTNPNAPENKVKKKV
ncbi:tRNA-specific adenosine deaminase 2 [Lycorma delicatula]|uniref:tRNA-specific adenosine deaminase 2 n=1 Tax=Lycorma delicatula TaxID=130591 RepID=UPI003F50EC2F